MRSLKHALAPIAVLAALVSSAGSAVAQGAPEYFTVGPLPAGDTLTVRSKPAASSAALGALHEGDGMIEAISVIRNGTTKWAEFIYGEGVGYVAVRFLTPAELPRIAGSALPVGLRCAGTEPFWSLDLSSETTASWSDPAAATDEAVEAEITQVLKAQARGGWPAQLSLSAGEKWSGELTVDAARCSDGMSDREYGWRAILSYSENPDQSTLVEGCCWLPIKE